MFMKKGLIGIIAGIGLLLGVNSASSQTYLDYHFKNKDKDSFSEEIFGAISGLSSSKIEGATYLAYFDEDGDNFYEHIRVINGADSRIFVEDFYIDPLKGPAFYGFLNYSLKEFDVNRKIFEKYIYKKNPEKLLKLKKFNIPIKSEEDYKNLNLDDLKKLKLLKRFEGFSEGCKSRKNFEDLLRKERSIGN